MNNQNEHRFRPTPPAFGFTNAEFANPWRPAEELPPPPPRPAGVQPLPKVEFSSSELEELVLEFLQEEEE